MPLPARHTHWSDRLKQALRDPGHRAESGRRLVFHAFSNGGVYLIACLLHLLEKRGLHVPPGSLFALFLDSAPTPTPHRRLREGAALYSEVFPRIFPQQLVHGALWVADLVSRRAMGRVPVLQQNRRMLLAHPLLRAAPILFLYSPSDHLVPPNDVEWTMEQAAKQVAGFPASADLGFATHEYDRSGTYTRRAQPPGSSPRPPGRTSDAAVGARPLVMGVRFPADSPHVQHFRHYPHEYALAVTTFLSKL
jgi:hypothetical protein